MSTDSAPLDLARKLIDEAIGKSRPSTFIATAPVTIPDASPVDDRIDRAASGYRTRYPTSREPAPPNENSPQISLLMGVTTWNRQRYIQRFIESFAATRNTEYDWTLVVADDGSTDGTLDYLRNVEIEGCTVVVIENRNRTITGQTNSILAASLLANPTLGFKADDDIFFVDKGWDDLYLAAAQTSGFDHLIYHNADWKPAQHQMTGDGVTSSVEVIDALGCFYTFTPNLIEDIGYLDEVNFQFRGHGHLDWSTRACRRGYNESANAWDASGSERFVQMWPRDDYESLVDWNSAEVKSILNDAERARRIELIQQPTRVYVEHRSTAPVPQIPRVWITPDNELLHSQLNAHSVARRPGSGDAAIDTVQVLNLEADQDKWITTAGMLARCGLEFERFPAVDGGTPDNVDEWREYTAAGLVLDLEKQLNRRLIQSTGAWGYLKTMHSLLEAAQSRRDQYILVFDDDIMVHRDMEQLLPKALHELPSVPAIVYLGNSQIDQSVATQVNDMLYHPGGEANGSFAVLFHASTFESLLNSIDRFDGPFDAGPLREIDHQRPRDVYAMQEPLVIADVSTSTIRKPRDMAAYAEKFEWDLERYEKRPLTNPDPTVSIIIVGTNIEADLPVILESLRWQTRPDIEVLVGDNGSSDNTPTTLRELRDRDTRVRVFRTERQIAPASMTNLLVNRSRAEWVSLLPAESNLPRSHYEELLRKVETDQADAVATGYASGIVPARITPGHQPSPEGRTYLGGLVRRVAVARVGGFLAVDGSGVNELIQRLSARVKSHGDDFRIADGSTSVALLRDRQRRTLQQEFRTFHDEIAGGHRSARIPTTTNLELVELV